MFGGVISHTGVVGSAVSVSPDSVGADSGVQSLIISVQDSFPEPALGASIAVNGVCLTVTRYNGNQLCFDLASETLRVTTLGLLHLGAPVHLEPALRVGDPIDGHFLSGHVDGIGTVCSLELSQGTWRFEFTYPPELAKFLVRKGSIAIDGVSLTTGEVTSDSFSVYIIPHTYSVTRFRTYEVGAKVNIEVDMLSRYMCRALELQNGVGAEIGDTDGTKKRHGE